MFLYLLFIITFHLFRYKQDKEDRWKRRNSARGMLEFHLNMEVDENSDPQESPEQLALEQHAQPNVNIPKEHRNNKIDDAVVLAVEGLCLLNNENNHPEMEENDLVDVRELLLQGLMNFQAN